MADVTVTPALVRPFPNTHVEQRELAADIDMGKFVCIDSNGKAALADADAAATARGIGIIVAVRTQGSVHGYSGEMASIAMFGRVGGFSGLTPGALSFASTTAGAIADAAPAGSSGDYLWIAGINFSATEIFLNPFTTDLAAQ